MNQDKENGLTLKDLNFINSLISEYSEAWSEYCEEWCITEATLSDKIAFCHSITEEEEEEY